jgi:hypothetical protein
VLSGKEKFSWDLITFYGLTGAENGIRHLIRIKTLYFQ